MDYYTKIRRLAGTEKIILSGATGAVAQAGKILLVRRHNLSRSWGLPGGVQELGETICETAQREIYEEVGLDLTATDLIGVYSGPEWDLEPADGPHIQQMTLFFAMTGPATEIVIQHSEVAEWGFFAPDNLPDPMMPCCRQKVQDWARYLGRPFFR